MPLQLKSTKLKKLERWIIILDLEYIKGIIRQNEALGRSKGERERKQRESDNASEWRGIIH